MSTITAFEIEKILKSCIQGEIQESDVHQWAEARYAVDEYETESEAVNEVLALLDMLDMNLTTKEDFPAFIKALTSPDYLNVISEHDAGVDIDKRKEQLKDNPLYAKFCA